MNSRIFRRRRGGALDSSDDVINREDSLYPIDLVWTETPAINDKIGRTTTWCDT